MDGVATMKRAFVSGILFVLCVVIVGCGVGWGLVGLFALFPEPQTTQIRTGGGELGSLTYLCKPIKKCEPRLRR